MAYVSDLISIRGTTEQNLIIKVNRPEELIGSETELIDYQFLIKMSISAHNFICSYRRYGYETIYVHHKSICTLDPIVILNEKDMN